MGGLFSQSMNNEWNEIKHHYNIEDLDIVYPPEPKIDPSKVGMKLHAFYEIDYFRCRSE